MLADHNGEPRPFLNMPLTYEQAGLGMAFHEAGHAVLSMAYGMHVITSEVIAWESEPGTWAVTGNTAHQTQDTPPWHYAAQCAAGETRPRHLPHGLRPVDPGARRCVRRRP
ncbi:hypothetical protein [Streptomyces sp. R08]|uniref:Peptidase M41 domain-containing protein n=1 Tax=Streptomyces sp. R08 TaxID=3238624 RepID=A0AB39MC18_9ACTN